MAAALPRETVIGMYGDSHIRHVGQTDFGLNFRLQTFERARGPDFFITMADHSSRLSAILEVPANTAIDSFLTSYTGNDLVYPNVPLKNIALGYLEIFTILQEYNIYPFFLPIFPRTNFEQKPNADPHNPTSPYPADIPPIPRSPRKYTQLAQIISACVKDHGEKSLGYNPITPLPQDIQLAPDGIHLTSESYQRVASQAAAYITRVMESDNRRWSSVSRPPPTASRPPPTLAPTHPRNVAPINNSAGRGRARQTVASRLFGLSSLPPPQ